MTQGPDRYGMFFGSSAQRRARHERPLRSRFIRLALSIVLTASACEPSRDPDPSARASISNTVSASTVSPAPSGPGRPASSDSFKTINVVLYQPDSVLQERLSGAETLATYMKSIQAVCSTFFADQRSPETLDVVVAIKPSNRARAWFVSSSRGDGDEVLDRLRQKIERLTPPAVRVGPVAFAIVATIAGAEREVPSPQGFSPPMPKEWKEAAAKMADRGLIPDDVLRSVWPE